MGATLLPRVLGEPGDPAQYRAALARLVQERERANADVNRATQGIADLLPRAIEAGISVVEAAKLSGVSRPTVYRMLAEARERRPLREVAAAFERALEQNDRALPAELAKHFGRSIGQLFEALAELYPLVTGDFQAIGPSAPTDLVKILPELGVPESIVLPMLLLQGQTTEYVAASTQLATGEVLGWATLGLLRVIPRLLEAPGSADQYATAAVNVDRRYRVGDPRRHKRFAL